MRLSPRGGGAAPLRALLIGLCAGPASAPAARGAPVVHGADDPAKALQRVSAATEVPVDQLEPRTLPELLRGLAPFLSTGAPVATCPAAGGPSAAELAEQLRVQLRDVLLPEAIATGARLPELLPCQAPGAAPADLALAWFRYGYALSLESKLDAARAAFAQALIFNPDLQWDPGLSPDGAPPFQAARDAHRAAVPGRLSLRPPADGPLRLDGRPVDGELPPLAPGRHVLEVDGQALAFPIEAGQDLRLLRPAAVAGADLPGLARGDADLALMADQALPPLSPAWAVIERQVYARPAAGATWDPVRGGKARPLEGALRWSGVGLMGAGAVLGLTGRVLAVGAAEDAALTADRDDYSALAGRYSAGTGMYVGGLTMLGLGAASFSGSWWLSAGPGLAGGVRW